MNLKKHNCAVCGLNLHNLRFQSPVINDELWASVLSYYQLSEGRPGPGLPAIQPLYICQDCMERALNRALCPEDIQDLPFNLYFRLHYAHDMSWSQLAIVRSTVEKYLNDSIDLPLSYSYQREIGFVYGLCWNFILRHK